MLASTLIVAGLILAYLLVLVLRVSTLTALTQTLTLTGKGGWTGAAGLGQGSGSLAAPGGIWSAMQTSLAFGVAAGQANQVYFGQRTIAAGGDDNLDLSGSLLSPAGDTIAFSKIKLVLISIEAPDGTKSLRVGPNGVANAFQGPFGAVTANVFKLVTNFDIVVNEPVAGYTVTAGTADLLPIHNPGAGAVTYDILIMGIG